jgi:DNA polymerase-3 subunit epsilon
MRTKHGALLDAEILAEIYLELLGGRQATLSLGLLSREIATIATARVVLPRPRPLAPRLTAEDENAHSAFLATFAHEPLWRRYAMPKPLGVEELSAAAG